MNRSQIYDAIVVGTGISGGWAAKELCEKGSKTLVPECGQIIEHIQDYLTMPDGGVKIGHDSKTVVVNGHKQLHNVYITDGAFMTSSSCATPYLTYMAFTARAAEHAADQLKKGIFS